jgi:pimeloyl-ACP methyl ester carboxylesterase
MHDHRSTVVEPALGALLICGLALGLTGCGVGPAGNAEKVSKTATTYLRALADGDAAKACAQLTRRARGDACEAAMKARLGRLGPDDLKRAADASQDIHVHGNAATTDLSNPHGARLVLAKVGTEWRIDSGFAVGSRTAAAARIPDTAIGRQLRWALAELNRGAAGLTATAVRAHFSPEFLSAAMPASGVAAMLGQTAQRGPFTFVGFAYPPSATQAVALLDTRSGERGSLRVRLDGHRPQRIVALEVDDAPPPIPATDPYTGRFDIGGRKLFLHCQGSGEPSVVFEGGLTTDWLDMQKRVARLTRACSYDPANGPWGRSDPAPTPRTAKDVVHDLHALLAAARVPGPYVLVGHSDGGLFAQLYASEQPRQVAGLVLIDAVSPSYYTRRIALLRRLLPPATFKVTIRHLRARVPTIVDPEQIDMETSLAQTRAALSAAPLRRMPLFVLTRGREDDPDTDPRINAADVRLWRSLQDGLARLVPGSRHVIATRSGHVIQHDQPELVVGAIRDVVRAVRAPASWNTR